MGVYRPQRSVALRTVPRLTGPLSVASPAGGGGTGVRVFVWCWPGSRPAALEDTRELGIPVAQPGLLLLVEVRRRQVPPGRRCQPERTFAASVRVDEHRKPDQVRLELEIIDSVLE